MEVTVPQHLRALQREFGIRGYGSLDVGNVVMPVALIADLRQPWSREQSGSQPIDYVFGTSLAAQGAAICAIGLRVVSNTLVRVNRIQHFSSGQTALGYRTSTNNPNFAQVIIPARHNLQGVSANTTVMNTLPGRDILSASNPNDQNFSFFTGNVVYDRTYDIWLDNNNTNGVCELYIATTAINSSLTVNFDITEWPTIEK